MKTRTLCILVAAILLLGALALSVSAENATVVQEWNIVLGDDIGANFYLEAPASASVKVTVGDSTQTVDLSQQTPNTKGLYKVSVNVAAAQMTEAITLQLVVDGTEYAPVSYSVRDYAVQILKGNYSAQVQNLVKHMLGYGAAAQTYFGINTDQPANAGYQLDYTAQYPAEYPAPAVSGAIDGVAFYGASLVMENKVAVRFYFTAESLEGVTFGNYTATKSGDMFCVEVPGIAPNAYNKPVTLTAQKGEQTLAVTYSPLTYMVRMSQKGSANLQALVNAMYGYYEAAIAYAQPFKATKGSWDLSNQYNGSLTITKGADGTTVMSNASNYRGVAVTVKDYTPSKNEDGSLKQGGFSAQIYFVFDNGKQYQVRLHNTDADGNYKLQNIGGTNNITGWKWQADLTTAQKEKLLNGDGVEFAVKLVGPNAELWVDGTRMATVALGADYDGKLAQIGLCMNGNKGVQNMVIPFELTTPTAPVALTLPTVTGGTVTVDSGYQVGDTIPVTVTPETGYSQKLYIDGKPLLLGWKTNTYNLVATQEAYEITGSFVPSIEMPTAGRWDTANQAHGILNAYYPSNNDAWKQEIKGEYKSIAIIVKNYRPQEDTIEGVAADGGFSAVLGVTMDNGNHYAFRIINKNNNGAPRYQYSRFGGAGLAGWGGGCVLNDKLPEATALINGEGAEFKLSRIGDNKLQLTLNGAILETYTMADITAEQKVASVSVYHYGNRGQKVEVPFTLVTEAEATDVQLNIAATEHGAVTAEHAQYQVGDTVVLTVTADSGYSQKLSINGEALMVDANGKYSFVATEEVYSITGSFEPVLVTANKGSWNLNNQNNGVLTITKGAEGTTVTTVANTYKEVSVVVKEHTPSKNADGSLKKGNFSAQIAMIFDDGKYYEVRIHNTNDDGNYKLQTVGGANNILGTGWKWIADLTAAQKAKLIDGDGVEFSVKLVGPNAELWVDGTRMAVVALGEAYAGKTAQVKVCLNGNTGVQNMHIPFELKTPADIPVQFNIPELANGTVAPDYDGYKLGDTVTLNVNADSGYSPALFINGEPMVLTVGTNTYSFEATEEIYEITGSFQPSLFTVTGGSWDLNNQFNGLITILNKTKDGSTVKTNAGGYNEVSVTVKDHTPSKNEDGTLKKGNFSMQVTFKFNDGKQYQVRIHNTDADGNYKLQTIGAANNLPNTKWKWLADLTTAQKANLLEGDGAKFTVKIVGSNAELWVDGKQMATVALGAEYEGQVTQVTLCLNGSNSGQNIEIPYELK